MTVRNGMLGFGAAIALWVGFATGCTPASTSDQTMHYDAFSSPTLAPLAAAVADADGAEIRRQIAAGTNPDTPGEGGATLLVAAIGDGKLASVDALLAAGADPNAPGGGGETPVAAAAFADNPALLKAVLAHGGKVNARSPVTGATALSSAILGQHTAQVGMLLAAGADPNLADLNDDAPIHVAARTNAGATILALLEAGAVPEARNSGGSSFQDYYFTFPRNILNAQALADRRSIIAWLKAHHVPLQAAAEGYG